MGIGSSTRQPLPATVLLQRVQRRDHLKRFQKQPSNHWWLGHFLPRGLRDHQEIPLPLPKLLGGQTLNRHPDAVVQRLSLRRKQESHLGSPMTIQTNETKPHLFKWL